MTERSHLHTSPPPGPPPGTGAADFYTRHSQPDFLEVGYAAAPPPVQAALTAEIDFLRQALSGTGLALELGCGNGRLLEVLHDCARRWVGLDFVHDFLAQARSRPRLRSDTGLLVGNMTRLPFADRTFDLVLCAQSTLGLLGDSKAAALREAARVLRPDGRLLVVVYSELSVVPRVQWYIEFHRRGRMARLDWARCTPGLLVTEDGHASACFRREELEPLFHEAGLAPKIERLGEIYWVVEARRPRD